MVDDLGRITSTRSFDYESKSDPIEYPITVRIKDDFGAEVMKVLNIQIKDQDLRLLIQPQLPR